MSARNLTVALNNGIQMPMIGFGTFTITGRDLIYQVINAALKAGYRSIDTATVYRNEGDIGFALGQLIPKYNLQRKDLFLTSKLAPVDHGTGRVRKAVESSLSRLNTPYLDLYLVHWPGAGNVPGSSPANADLRAQTWAELEQLQREGLLRAIGVSNYTEQHLTQLLSYCKIPPVLNQVEFHPHYYNKSLLEFCNAHNIHLQAYSSLGGHSSEHLLKDPVVQEVACHTGHSVVQVLLKWALQQKVGIIPKSIKLDRIAANIELDFELSASAMEKLCSLRKQQKYAWDPTTIA